MVIDVEYVEKSFSWETFKDGLPYLGTYKNEIPGILEWCNLNIFFTHVQLVDTETKNRTGY